MPYGMYISAEGAQAQAQRLDVIANNLANIDTVGFKPDVATFQARLAEAIQEGMVAEGDGTVDDVGGGISLIDVQTDFSAGRLKRTGNDLDLAIAGDGFFNVAGEDGQTYLTRAGDFMLDAEGRLVTQNGQRPVLDQSGGEIVLQRDEPWNVTPDGFLSQAGSVFAIGLSRPQSTDELLKVGGNRFRAEGQVDAVAANERHVRQGYLEMSGANPTRQMIEMIETTRAFEANTRMIQNQDSMLSSLITRVLGS